MGGLKESRGESDFEKNVQAGGRLGGGEGGDESSEKERLFCFVKESRNCFFGCNKVRQVR